MWPSLGGHFSAYHIPYIHCITKSCSLCKFLDLVAFHFHCSYLWLGPLNCSPSFMPLVVPSLCCYHNHLWKMHVYPFHTCHCQADQVHTSEPGSQGSFLLVQSRVLLFLSALLQSPQVLALLSNWLPGSVLMFMQLPYCLGVLFLLHLYLTNLYLSCIIQPRHYLLRSPHFHSLSP